MYLRKWKASVCHLLEPRDRRGGVALQATAY